MNAKQIEAIKHFLKNGDVTICYIENEAITIKVTSEFWRIDKKGNYKFLGETK